MGRCYQRLARLFGGAKDRVGAATKSERAGGGGQCSHLDDSGGIRDTEPVVSTSPSVVSNGVFSPAGVAQLVERQPSKLNVDGSNPFTRFSRILNVAVFV